MQNFNKYIIAFLAISLLIIPACNKKAMTSITAGTTKETTKKIVKTKTENTPKPKEETKIKPTPTPEIKEDSYIMDGFVIPVDGTRPIAVMIDNQGDKVLPQGGLQKAQIVYEMFVEYGITRYMPVFWNSTPEMIGPVRSSRHYFLDYAMGLDAIYVHFGYSPRAYEELSKFGINNVNGINSDGNTFWDITKDPYNWQDSYTSNKKIDTAIENSKYRNTSELAFPFEFHETDYDLESDYIADNIFIKYDRNNTCGYYYDEDARAYMRLRMGKPHNERNSSEVIMVKNIIVQTNAHSKISGDTEGRIHITSTGSGKGYYITNGKSIEITWEKSARDSKTNYYLADGSLLNINRGNTWIQIISSGTELRIE